MIFSPHAAAAHWATGLVGKPWAPGADGPDAYDCRGLVRHVYRLRAGVDVPALAAEIADDGAAIMAAARTHGWRLVGRGIGFKAEALELDIVLMSGQRGPHVGVLIEADRALKLLHCVGGMVNGRATGSVVSDTLDLAGLRGYGKFEFWRRLREAAA